MKKYVKIISTTNPKKLLHKTLVKMGKGTTLM
jgi:hypothetical protein